MDIILDADQAMQSARAQLQPRIIAKARHRLVASLCDAMVLLPVSFFIYYVVPSTESATATIGINVLSLVYKPYMEYTFGATLGKKFIELEVVTTTFGKPGLRSILLRNGFGIFYNVMSIMATGAIVVSTKMGVVPSLVWATSLSVSSVLFGIIVVADFLRMITDFQRRSLHDRLGDTLVVEKSKAHPKPEINPLTP